jgi:hypothetical protein
VDRYRMKLAGYRFQVSHVSGEKNPCDYGSWAGWKMMQLATQSDKELQKVKEDLGRASAVTG